MEKQPFVGTEDALTEKIIGVFYEVFNELGYGFAESVYGRGMAIALSQKGLTVASEVAIPVSFRGNLVGVFKCDLMVVRKIILELKIADQVTKAYEGQLLHYLRASPVEIGLILCFGQVPKFRRMEFRNERKTLVAAPA